MSDNLATGLGLALLIARTTLIVLGAIAVNGFIPDAAWITLGGAIITITIVRIIRERRAPPTTKPPSPHS